MKKILLLLTAFQCCFLMLMAQTNLPPVDKSPMDMSYFPSNYPVLKIQDKPLDDLIARIIYSRPQKAGRTVFGELVKYGEVWRLGANEATEIEFFKNVRIGDKKISKGRYTLYAIVNETEWTMILSRETDTWGSFRYNAKNDVLRATATVQKSSNVVEALTMAFEKTASGCNLVVAWDNVRAVLPITL